MSQPRTAISYVVLSAVGAALIVGVAWVQASDSPAIDLANRLIVGGAFIAGSALGVSLALRPNWLRKLMGRASNGMKRQALRRRQRFRGHHPDCDRFRGHAINTRRGALCAGCTGLVIGAALSIPTMSAYIALPVEVPRGVLRLLLVLGVSLIAAKYVEAVLPVGNPGSRLTFNALFVFGFLFLVIGAYESTGDVGFGLLGVVLSFLFLDTRIKLSHWRHASICEDCGEPCKAYGPRASSEWL